MYINNKAVYGTKNFIDLGFIKQVFKKSDNCIIERKFREWLAYDPEDVENQDEIGMAYFFRSSVGKIKDRLKILGYKRSQLEGSFLEHKNKKIEELNASIDVFISSKHEKITKDVIAFTKKEIEFWNNTSVSDFLLASREILLNKEQEVLSFEKSIENFSSAKKYLLSEFNYLLDELPFSGYLNTLGALLDNIPEDWVVIYEYTDFIESGDLEEDFLNDEVEEKIIILTEGISDINILEPSLNLLYPHLSEYYNFNDFKNYKLPGSASDLINIIKAFAASGIKNKVIAIFDNDTAAKEAQSILRSIEIPSNIKILNYPDTELANDYPTIGPSGLIRMNVNGLAGSIELYTGRDVLNISDNGLSPVQWKGFSAKLNAYQGEIQNKKDIQERFKEKLTNAQSNPLIIDTQDWSEIKKILNMIFEAFD